MPAAAERRIVNAVEDSEEVRDWIDVLLENARDDPGAPFVPENLSRIAELYHDDQPAFERLRVKLRDTKVRVGELSKAIANTQSVEKAPSSGAGLDWDEDEAWPHPVDGERLLNEIVTTIRRFLVLPEHAAQAMALWAAFSHALEGFWKRPMKVRPRAASRDSIAIRAR